MKILVSGFKPFLNETINPSELLANFLKDSDSMLSTIVLPVEFERAFEILKNKIESVQPDVLIMLGQAGGRKNICLEKIALNWNQTESADENGFKPSMGVIQGDLELALMSTFPIDRTFQDLKSKKLPFEISFSAGTFVCNNLYFKVLSAYPQIQSVFVHVPFLPEQVQKPDVPSMDLDVMKEAIASLVDRLRLRV